jgi:hypothetical protein
MAAPFCDDDVIRHGESPGRVWRRRQSGMENNS